MHLTQLLDELFSSVNWRLTLNEVDEWRANRTEASCLQSPDDVVSSTENPQASTVLVVSTVARHWHRLGRVMVTADTTLQNLLACTPAGPLTEQDLLSPWGFHATWFDPGFSFHKRDGGAQVIRAAMIGKGTSPECYGFMVGEDTSNVPFVGVGIKDFETSFTPSKYPGQTEQVQAVVRALRVAIGLTRLITSHHEPSHREDGDSSRLVSIDKKQESKKWGTRNVHVRKLFVVDPRVSDACREALRGGPRAPCLRHLVRGHWRNQACGEDHKSRELIWIQPFWRGSLRDVFAPKVVKVV